jgi:hypothetical protein
MGSRYSPAHSVATKDIFYPSLVALALAIVPWIATALFAHFWRAKFLELGPFGGGFLFAIAISVSGLMIAVALTFFLGGFLSRALSRWLYHRRQNANDSFTGKSL